MGSLPYLAGGSGQGSQHPAMWLVPSHPAHSAWPPACALPPPAVVLPSCVPGCRSFGGQKWGQEGQTGCEGGRACLGTVAGSAVWCRAARRGCCRAPGKGFTLEMGPIPNLVVWVGTQDLLLSQQCQGSGRRAGTCVEWRGCRGAGGGLRAAFTPSRDLAALVIPGVGGWVPPVCIQEQQRGLGLPTGGSQRGRDHSISSANQTPLFLFFFL